MNSSNGTSNNMYLLINCIAFFAIFSELRILRSVMVNAEMDVNLMESNGKSAHEHDASLTSDSSFFDNEQYLHNMNDDVETVPTNVSIGSTYSGKLYNYDDYFGSIDMNPETNTYDYGK